MQSTSQTLALLSFITLTAACSGAPKTPAKPQPAVTADTWATVDGRVISKNDVEKAYAAAGNNEGLSDEEALSGKLNLLDTLITQDILVARGQKLNVQVPQADVDAAFNNTKQNIPDAEFQKELDRRHLTAEEMKDGMRKQLLAQKVIEQDVAQKIAVSDQEVTDFFNANKDQFNLKEESYRIAQIVITPTREPQQVNRTGSDASTPQEAQAKAQMIMQQLKAGANFGELATNYSEDPESGQRGGDLGMMPVSQLKQAPPALRDAVLNSKPGTAKLVSAGGGYTIVLVLDHQPAGQRDLNTPGLKDNISQMLKDRKEQLVRVAYVTAARTDADVVNYLARRIVESRGVPR